VSREARHNDTPKDVLMITVTRCSWAAGMVLIATSLSAAGDSPGVAINPDRTTALLPRDELPGQDPGRLETRRPYERGKVPVVLIHGLWGSPRNWDRMIEDLEANPAIRARFQFWTLRYASGDSIPYSAHVLRQSLRRARRAFDPDGTDAAFDRMVVVGHSLGGILAKMMVQSSGPRLWQTVCTRPIDQVIGPPEECQLLQQAFFYKPVPEVRRVIFIATPHRGSPLASGRLKELGTQLCWRPNRFFRAHEVVLSNNEPDIFAHGFRDQLPTSAGELAPGHPLLLRLCDLGIDSSVRSHSIIADLRDPPRPDGTDGIVPYSSSHMDGVASELLVHGLHICVNHPAVIEEVRRILMEHATLLAEHSSRH
jgi:triacylglycerol esterase/lipase EstA (alpha/beta hydrolase family)